MVNGLACQTGSQDAASSVRAQWLCALASVIEGGPVGQLAAGEPVAGLPTSWVIRRAVAPHLAAGWHVKGFAEEGHAVTARSRCGLVGEKRVVAADAAVLHGVVTAGSRTRCETERCRK